MEHNSRRPIRTVVDKGHSVCGVRARMLGGNEANLAGSRTANVYTADTEAATVNVYREVAQKAMEFSDHRDMFICGSRNREMAYDVTLVAMGKGHFIGCKTMVELARRYRVTKQAIHKLVIKYQEINGIPPIRS